VVDQAVPLYNVVVNELRFFATTEQITEFVAQFELSPEALLMQPSWKWVFDSGFEHSLDGALEKRWRLIGG
ncbi:hypothetical protein, partial [Caballeronia sp. GACF4]|uniref:hypothetical protein n=1 Tax=Caballeronia sp. GACF4 TaxID=2921763 RepID=UPI002027DAF9